MRSEIPAPGARFNISFRNELAIRAFDRDDAHSQVVGKLALRGKLFACRDGAVFDVGAHAVVQKRVQRFFSALVHIVGKHGARFQTGLIALVN